MTTTKTLIPTLCQSFLAFHTLAGAVFKTSHSEQTIPSLSTIPHSIWLSLISLELACTGGLIFALINKKWTTISTTLSCSGIILEMVLFVVIHIKSGDDEYGPMMYWLVVAIFCMGMIYYRISSSGSNLNNTKRLKTKN
jgi:Na+-transporting NADH:ubiquinone oxidoreductase subunit NqrB